MMYQPLAMRGEEEELNMSDLGNIRPNSVTFDATGTKLFIAEENNARIFEYSLTTPFDVSTGSLIGNYTVSGQLNEPQDLVFSSDGLNMFILGNSRIFEYALPNPYDVDNRTYAGDGERYNISSRHEAAEGMAFRPDGKKMFVVGRNNTRTRRDYVSEYRLAIPYDVSTATFAGQDEEFDLRRGGSTTIDVFTHGGITFSPDGRNMFIISSFGDIVLEFPLGPVGEIEENSNDPIQDFDANDGVGGATDSSVRYRLEGPDARLFRINSLGVISFRSTPNFEDPQDANADNEYEITVVATNSTNDRVEQEYFVFVIDEEPENAPNFTSPGRLNVEENQTGTVYTATADKPVTFSLDTDKDAQVFNLTGANLSFRSPPDFENPDDGNKNNIYVVDLIATDALGNVAFKEVTIIVTNVSEPNNPPVFTSAASAAILENAPVAVVVLNVNANDGDGGTIDANITYSLSGVDANYFIIDSEDGELRFNTSPDFENPDDVGRDNIYNVTVTATDNGDASGNSSSQAITISVTNEDEGVVENNAPVFSSASSASVAENTPIATVVLDVNATDGDDGAVDANVAYTISGIDAEDFTIDSNDGEIRFVAVPNFENPSDDGGNNVYNITVTANDSESENNTSTQAILITVTDVDEGTQENTAPIFESSGSVLVVENTPVSTVILDVNATDGDGGVVDANVTYSISGVDDRNFIIDSDDGEIRFVAVPNFENPSDDGGDNVYDIIVAADDGESENNTSTQAITISVTDVDEGTRENRAPIFSTSGSVSIVENTPLTSIVLDVDATDGDGGAVDQNITYTLSGVDATDFIIDSDNGEIRFTSVPDFEDPTDNDGNNIYRMTVMADDGEPENNTTTLSITITVTDLDDEVLSLEDDSSGLLIYGNSTKLNIEYTGKAIERVFIHDMTGKLIYDELVNFVTNKVIIRPVLLPNQVYTLRINSQSVKFKIE